MGPRQQSHRGRRLRLRFWIPSAPLGQGRQRLGRARFAQSQLGPRLGRTCRSPLLHPVPQGRDQPLHPLSSRGIRQQPPLLALLRERGNRTVYLRQSIEPLAEVGQRHLSLAASSSSRKLMSASLGQRRNLSGSFTSPLWTSILIYAGLYSPSTVSRLKSTCFCYVYPIYVLISYPLYIYIPR